MTDRDPKATPSAGDAALTRAVELDRDGREADAIPVYREALSLGLSAELDYRARLGLASSLRETDQAAEAVQVHRETAERWPRRGANRLFLALALLQAGAPQAAVGEAISVALEAAGDDGELAAYAPALREYVERLGDGDD